MRERLRDFSQKKERKKEKKDKSRNLFKFVSVLLSESVERVGVSRMRDFYSIFWYNKNPIVSVWYYHMPFFSNVETQLAGGPGNLIP